MRRSMEQLALHPGVAPPPVPAHKPNSTKRMKTIRSSLSVLLALAPSLLRATTLTNDTTINSGDATYDTQDIVVSGCTLTVNGPHSFNSLQVIAGGILTHTAAASGQPNNQVNLTIAHDMLVDAASRIDVSVKGYNAAYPGPGAGVTGTINGDWGSGGGYGGFGADSTAGAKAAPPMAQSRSRWTGAAPAAHAPRMEVWAARVAGRST